MKLTPEGTHRAQCSGIQWGKTQNGDPQVALTFRLIDIPGRTLTWFGFFHGKDHEKAKKNAERSLQSIAYCGWPKGKMLQDLTADDLSSLVEVVVKHEEDREGKLRDRIAWVNRPGGGGIQLQNPMDDTEKRQFAARIKRLMGSVNFVDPIPVPEVSHADTDADQSQDPDDYGDGPGGYFDDDPGPAEDNLPF